MVRVAITITLVAIWGCHDKTLEQLKDVRDQVCACTTSACGEQAMALLPQSDVRPNHEARALANQMLACMAKLYGRERPSSDPDRPTADPDSGSANPR